MEFSFREATIQDSRLLFKWINDSEVRRFSFNTKKIEYHDHINWLKQKLNDPNCKILIFLKGNTPIGQVRLEKYDYGLEINISVDPSVRGKDYGSQIITLSKAYCIQRWGLCRILAHIKLDNIPSIRAFEKAGFVKTGEVVFNSHNCLEMTAGE